MHLLEMILTVLYQSTTRCHLQKCCLKDILQQIWTFQSQSRHNGDQIGCKRFCIYYFWKWSFIRLIYYCFPLIYTGDINFIPLLTIKFWYLSKVFIGLFNCLQLCLSVFFHTSEHICSIFEKRLSFWLHPKKLFLKPKV